MKRANALDVQSLERSDQITLALLKDNLQTFADGYKWKEYVSLKLAFMHVQCRHLIPALKVWATQA